MSSGLCLALEGLSLSKQNPSWEEPLQKSQFLTENSLKMSHFRPTSRGEDLGEHQCGKLSWGGSSKSAKLGGKWWEHVREFFQAGKAGKAEKADFDPRPPIEIFI